MKRPIAKSSPRSLTVEALESRALLAGMFAPPVEYHLYAVPVDAFPAHFASSRPVEFRPIVEVIRIDAVHRLPSAPVSPNYEEHELPPSSPPIEVPASLPPAAGEAATSPPTPASTPINPPAPMPTTVVGHSMDTASSAAPRETYASRQTSDPSAIAAVAFSNARQALDAEAKDAVFAAASNQEITPSAVDAAFHRLSSADWSLAALQVNVRGADFQSDMPNAVMEAGPSGESAAIKPNKPETAPGEHAPETCAPDAFYVARSRLDWQPAANQQTDRDAQIPADGGLAEVALAAADYRLMGTIPSTASGGDEALDRTDDVLVESWIAALPSRTQSFLMTALCSLAAVWHLRRREKQDSAPSTAASRLKRARSEATDKTAP